MTKVFIKLKGFEELENELDRLNSVRFEAVRIKQVLQMFDRAKKNKENAKGGTPVDTGELRISIVNTENEVGYLKDYAPHVEYGHRTKNGGYVKGQKFLKDNVDIQRGVYKKDLIKAINKEKS